MADPTNPLDYLNPSSPSFFFAGGSGGVAPSYADLQRRRQIAVANAMRGRPYPKNIGEGITAIGEGLGEARAMSQLAEAEKALAAKDTLSPPPVTGTSPPAVRSDAGDATVPTNPVAYAPTADNPGRAAITQAIVRSTAPGVPQQNPTDTEGPTPPVTSPVPDPGSSAPADSILAARQQAIGGIESGGRNDPYATVGVPTKYGPALGRYGIVQANVGPWSKAALGQELTPQQFLSSPQAQDAIFNHRMGLYADKYGEENAARAWFGGPGNIQNTGATDAFGRLNVGTYGQDYMRRMQGAQRGAPTSALTSPDTMSDAPPLGVPSSMMAFAAGAPAEAAGNPPIPTDIQPAPVMVADAGATSRPAGVPPVPAGARPPVPPAAGAVPSTTMPTSTVNPFPDPGPEPKPPPPTPQMDYYRKASEETWRSPETRAEATRLYEDQQRIQREDFTRQWNLWKENRQARQQYELNQPAIEAARAQQALTLKQAQEAETVKAAYGNLPPPVAAHLDASTQLAKTAAGSLEAFSNAKVAMDAGTIFGFGADAKLNAYRLAALAGNKDAARIVAATETFKQNLGPIIQSTIKGYAGSQISNRDLDFARQMAGQDITLNKESAQRLLAIGEQAARQTIKEHGEKVDAALAGQPEPARPLLRSMYYVREPLPSVPVGGGGPPSAAPGSAPASAAGSATAAPAVTDGTTATGPGGQKLIRRGGRWEPM
jgi:hypothetical protein